VDLSQEYTTFMLIPLCGGDGKHFPMGCVVSSNYWLWSCPNDLSRSSMYGIGGRLMLEEAPYDVE
jgi:hypothetical protein